MVRGKARSRAPGLIRSFRSAFVAARPGHQSLRTASTSPVQPNPRPLAIGELHSRLLEGLPDSCQSLRLALRCAALDGMNSVEVNFGLLAKVPHTPIQKAPC